METLSYIMVWIMPPIVLCFFVIIGGKKSAFAQNLIVLVVFAWISLFAAFRYQLGDDWAAYELYYDAIDIHMNIVDGYLFGNPLMLQFEPGYYILSYICKGLGFSYIAVNLLSVILLAFAILNLCYKESLPLMIVVLIFVGLPQFSLYYNQVRQAFAIAFVLIALNTKSNKALGIFSLLAISFQASSAIFSALVMIARFFPKYSRLLYKASLAFLPIAASLVFFARLNLYEVLRLVVPPTLLFKIDIYQEEATNFGVLRLSTILYLIVISVFIFRLMSKLSALTAWQHSIIRLSILCCLLVPYSAILFPNSYAFFNRSLVFAMIIISFSAAIIGRFRMNVHGVTMTLAPFYGLGFISIAYYYVSLHLYESVLVPYKSFIVL